MPMTGPLTDWQFICDRCETEDHTSEHAELDVYTKAEALRIMRRQGWRIGKQVICPYCDPDGNIPRDADGRLST